MNILRNSVKFFGANSIDSPLTPEQGVPLRFERDEGISKFANIPERDDGIVRNIFSIDVSVVAQLRTHDL